MASRREYDMLFQLSAQMNGNFTGTFSKAQQQLLSFQKEIQELNKAQGNISAYEKQQQAVESTKKKLETLQQQYDNIQREIQETGEFSSTLENKLLSKQQQIDKTAASLERQTQKLDQMGGSLREAGIDTGNLEKETARLGAEMADLKKKQEDAAEGAKSFGRESSQAFAAAGDALVAAGIAAALHEIYEEYMECISVAGAFEESMSNVEALSGASAEELRQLSNMAKELGATTKFTAKESADAMGYMAMAGWDAQQMIGGMSGVLNLAAASGEDLAATADIVTDNLTAFGMKASDTAHFSDVLAATASSSNTSVAIMGETFKNSAALAGALGYSIEDVAVAIGLMANAGIKGSNAGTALKNVFNGLLSGVTLTSEAFGEVEYSAINADGTMKSFGETLKDLREYFEQMTGAEKLQNAETLAGQRAMAGFVSIMNSTDADFQKLTSNIENCSGAAQKMADIKMDNLNGQLTLMNSAADALKTTVGEAYDEELRALAKIGTDILSGINDFLQKHPILLKSLIAITAEVGLIVGAYYGYIAAKKIMNTVRELSAILHAKETAATVAETVATEAQTVATTEATAAQVGLNAAMKANPIGLVIGAAAALTVGLVALVQVIKSVESEEDKLTLKARQQKKELDDLNAQYKETVELYGESSYEAQSLKWRIDELTAAYEEGKQTVEEYEEALRSYIDARNSERAEYKNAFAEIDSTYESTDALISKIEELSASSISLAGNQSAVMAIVSSLNDKYGDLGLTFDATTGKLNMSTSELHEYAQQMHDATEAAEKFREYSDAVAKSKQDKTVYEDAKSQYEPYKMAAEDAEKAYSDYVGSFQYYLEVLGTAIRSQSDSSLQGLQDTIPYSEILRSNWEEAQKQAAQFKADFEEAERNYNETLATIEAFESQYGTTEEEISEGILTGTISSVTDEVKILTKAYNEAYEAALASIKGQYDLWDEADKVVVTSAGSINNALESQIAYWNDYNANLEALRSRASDIEGLSDVIASFADGSNESVNAVAGMASATDEDLAAMVQNWRDLQQAQSETSEVIADFKTDFTNQMDELTQQLQEDVEALDMSADAAESGRATIQAFIDSAAAMEPTVRRAYASLGRAAAAAMSNASGTNITVNSHGYAIGTNYAEPGFALVGEQGPELMLMRGGEKILTAAETRALQEEYTEIVMLLPELFKQLHGYSVGTDNAAPGLAWVGEQGPEAILGAQFAIPRIDAEEAISDVPIRRADGEKYVVSFAPVYNINGDMDSYELEALLREHDEKIKEQMEELLEEIEEEKARRYYR